ncbi:MAG: formate/nitrite transporter family protein [Lachnospiraceae bacterium]|nr:formate/nitrite transporter family protein [Lachnospiraceae bacterium]
MKVKDFFKTLIPAVYAGLCIGIGGSVFIACENKIAGAFMFTVGLFTILIFGFNLFTGKVGYICQRKPSYILEVLTVWLGNFIGTYLVAFLLRFTRVYESLVTKCNTMVAVKESDSLLSLLILGIFCGMLMFIAVDSFGKCENKVTATLIVILGVMVFILAGFEHCIADMFYFALTKSYPDALLMLLVITIGNAIGGNLIPLMQNIQKKLNA